jgi:hypothetical protein
MAQRVQNTRHRLGVHAAQESNDANDTLELDALEALLEGPGAANFDDVVDTGVVACQTASDLAPVWLCLVVDDVVGAELLELLALGV